MSVWTMKVLGAVGNDWGPDWAAAHMLMGGHMLTRLPTVIGTVRY